MKKVLISIGLLCGVFSAYAQTSFEEIKENPLKAGGIYLAYPVTESANTPAPKGYEPFYISHYSRHGSRYLIGDRDYRRVLDLMQKGHDAGALTPLGEDVGRQVLYH